MSDIWVLFTYHSLFRLLSKKVVRVAHLIKSSVRIVISCFFLLLFSKKKYVRINIKKLLTHSIKSCNASLLIIFLNILLLSPNISSAQGLAGKRFLLSYDAKMFNSLKEPIYRDQLKDTHHWLKFNYTHQAGIEYVLSARLSTGLNYQSYRTNSSDSKFYILSRGGGVYIKGFLRQNGSIAPIGSWWKVSYIQYLYQAKRITDFWQKGYYANGEVQLSFGRQTVLYKDLLLNVGLEIGGSITNGKSKLDPHIDPEDFLQQIISRINSHNTIFLQIGLAYAIF